MFDCLQSDSDDDNEDNSEYKYKYKCKHKYKYYFTVSGLLTLILTIQKHPRSNADQEKKSWSHWTMIFAGDISLLGFVVEFEEMFVVPSIKSFVDKLPPPCWESS